MVATVEPTLVYAGDTVTWQRSLSEYPAPAWLLHYFFASETNTFELNSTASNEDHLILVQSGESGDWVAGYYGWQLRAEEQLEGGRVVTIGTGGMTIKAAFSAAADARSHARKMIEAIQAQIEQRPLSFTQRSYKIGDRELVRVPLTELQDALEYYRAQVAAEEAAANPDLAAQKTRVLVRFARAS